MNPLVSVVIATYNRAEMVARCVASVLASDYTPLEVIVVNDHSPDNTATLLHEKFGSDARVKVITNEVNLKTCGSRNRGAQEAKGDFLLFLDHDNLIHADMIGELVACLEKDPKLGLVGPITINHGEGKDGEIWSLGSDFNRWTSQPKDFQPHTRIQDFQPTQPLYPTTYIPNASLVRRALFEQIGGFDESIGMMFDESDYGWRIGKCGWQAGICVAARTDHYHLGEAGCHPTLRHLGIEKPRRAYLFGRNRLKFAKRHFSFWQVVSVMCVFAPLSAVYYGVVALKCRRPDIAWAYLKGTLAGIFLR